ncbi:terminase small subunit [Aerococcus urinaeequi]|uniref:terminase small subunit n=1 Tax=Aerococcus urinaeequi TaxID=51665 RepID=UPI003AAC8B75
MFIDEYLKLRRSNQKKTAMNAGYSKKSAEAQASQLLKNPRVRAYLDERESQLEKGLRKEFMFVALEARKVMFEIMNDEEAPDNVRVSAAKDFLDRVGLRGLNIVQEG